MAKNDSETGDFESTLKQHARELVSSLESGDFSEAVLLIHRLDKARDLHVYHEVGKLTRELHNAIVGLQLDGGGEHAKELSQISDATDRLSYVVQMTEKAANRTMDLVEESAPLVNYISYESQSLMADWQRFMRREMSADEFRELAKRIENYLSRGLQDSDQLSRNLNDILLAQDFQDLTGQVIKRVTQLITKVESDLLKLMLMASKVDRYTGMRHEPAEPVQAPEKKKSSQGEGPQIHADKREDVVSNQDDVDDLLSSLGF
ncbi:protein phosphatase CheZ [Pseudomonas sp. Marseille-QA0892]